jgi:alpha/beta superfamily hydrolase
MGSNSRIAFSWLWCLHFSFGAWIEVTLAYACPEVVGPRDATQIPLHPKATNGETEISSSKSPTLIGAGADCDDRRAEMRTTISFLTS